MDNFSSARSAQKSILGIYFIISAVVFGGAALRKGITNDKVLILLAILGVFLLLHSFVILSKKFSDETTGVISAAISIATVFYVAFFWNEFKYLHLGLLMVSIMMCLLEMVRVNYSVLRFTALAYAISITQGYFWSGETRALVTINLLTAIVVMLGQALLAFLVRKVKRYKKVVKENATSSKDMLKVVEMKRLEAEQATTAKTLFLSNMSHEIRTPLNAILGMDEMILRESNESNVIDYATRIQNAGGTLLSLINDILDFSKIEAGKMEIVKEKYNFIDVVDGLYNLTHIRAEEKGLKLDFEIAKDIPSVLFGDSLRVKQVILNVLNNAVKYTEKGSVTLKIDWKPEKNDQIKLYIAVADTGVGIKEENMGKLFSSFDRIEETHTKYVEGTGLGMSITKNLLDMMDGSIYVESKYGEGSTFYISIIQDVIVYKGIGRFDARNKNVKNTQKYHESIVAPNANVLVVDDNELNLMVFKGLLKRSMVKIDTAKSGRQCIELVKNKKYDIIFMDHMMPEMDGIETYEFMKKMSDNLSINAPVVALTANAVTGSKEMYISKGFTNYLSKPVDGKKLEKMLIEYLPHDDVTVYEEIIPQEKEAERIDSVINYAEGINFAGGSEEQYLDTLSLFAETSKQKRRVLEDCKEKEDWKTYTIEVHALKSNAKYIGADELSEIAYEHEQAGKTYDTDTINSKWDLLCDVWETVLLKVREKLNMTEPVEVVSNGIVLSEFEYNMYIDELVGNLKSFEDEIAEKLINDILEYDLPKDTREVLNKVKEEIDRFNYKAALELLGK